MNNAPRVTFVVPTFNYAHFLPFAVDSILEQTFQPIEVIVVDDASTDDTEQVLERYRDDPRVRVIRHRDNIGHIRSYNEGLSAARGELIGLLSADDFCAQTDAVARQVAIFDEDPDVGFVYSAILVADDVRGVRWVKRLWPSDFVRDGLDEFAHLVFDNYVPASGTLVRARCHREVGYYDERLPHAGDWDMWLRLAARYRVGYVADPLYAYRMHRVNMHHDGMAVARTTNDHVLTVEKAFEALPPDAPRRARALRRPALRRAWIRAVHVERAAGRTRRSWRSAADVVRRAPGAVLTPEFAVAITKLVATMALGQGRWLALSRWRKRLTARLQGRPAV